MSSKKIGLAIIGTGMAAKPHALALNELKDDINVVGVFSRNKEKRENFSKNYAGAVSIFVNSTSRISKFKRNITVYGSTNYTKFLSKNYENIELKKNLFSSQSKNYVKKFLEIQNSRKI